MNSERKKIRLYLDGYINYSTAQNLNMLDLAKYIDKQRFHVYTLALEHGDLEISPMEGVTVFVCRYPFRITQWLGFLWGIWRSDIVYLNRIRHRGMKLQILNWFGKKVFTHVEENITPKYLIYFASQFKSKSSFFRSWQLYDGAFALTSYMRDKSFNQHGIRLSERILRLGTDTSMFANSEKKIVKVKNLIFVGRLMHYKGIFFICDLAKNFVDMHFHIVGYGDDEERLKQVIEKESITNITLYGKLTHHELSELYKDMDLFIFPSGEQEGFGKVLLETSAAGVPFLTNRKFGADTWAKEDVEAFFVDDNQDMIQKIESIRDDIAQLKQVSRQATELAKSYDWQLVVKEWEEVIEQMVDSSSATV